MARSRRSHRSRWENPASPLQATRYERRWTGKETVARVRAVCKGHGDGPCKLELSKLSDYEVGRRRPSIEHIVAFAKVYQKSPEELGLIDWRDDAPQPDPNAVNVTTTSDVLLRLLPPIATQQLPRELLDQPSDADDTDSDPFLLLIRRDQERLTATRLSDHQLQRLVAAVDHHARHYHQLTDPEQMRGLLTAWTTTRQALPLLQTLKQRHALTNIYARLSGVLASLTFDHGQADRAGAFLAIASDAAKESGDTDLLGWLYALHATICDWDHSPREVLTLARLGLNATGNAPTPTTAKLHGKAATAFAALGDHEAVTAHLEAAGCILTNPTAGCWPADAEMPRGFTYTTDSLSAATAKSHLRLDDYAKAASLSEEAARLQEQHDLSPASTLAVPLNQLNLATALLHTGEPDHACKIARTAIQDYRGVAITRLLRRGNAFAAELATTHPDSAHSREFAEFLHERPSPP